MEENAEMWGVNFLWDACTSMNFFSAGYCRRLNGEVGKFGPISEPVSVNEDDDKFDCWWGNAVWGIDEIKGGGGNECVVEWSSCNGGLSLLPFLTSVSLSTKDR